MCYVWTFADRVKEQEKQMPLEKYMIKEEDFAYCLRRPLASRLVDYALTAWLACTSTFGMVIGALWALGYIDIWMIPQW